MAKVFVSYSRRDIEFAKRLTAELQKSDLDFWIDWEGIPPTVDWWKEIEKGIEETDAFLFLISPDSAKSKVCGQELDVAVKNGKRLIPIVVREIAWEDTPPHLGHLNYIFFRESDNFNSAVQKLLSAIHTDFEWAQIHRRLQVKALEWERNDHESSFLLHGKELQEIESQLIDNTAKEPHPTALQSRYVFESRKTADKQLRSSRIRLVTISGVGIVLVVIIALAQIGIFNRFVYRPVDMENYWVTIPAGEFRMGNENGNNLYESPIHAVYLDTYQIGKHEVTNRQYNQCVKAGTCSAPNNKIFSIQEYKLHPVVNVSWNDANTYCEWIGGRLPTEAEWEKAARGTDERIYPWGNSIDCSFANYFDSTNRHEPCVGNTTPVGSYEKGMSPYGVYDMTGNVLEWVNDWSSDTYYRSSPSTNPSGPESGNKRVLRGGPYLTGELGVTVTVRYSDVPASSSEEVGFRCARDIP